MHQKSGWFVQLLFSVVQAFPSHRGILPKSARIGMVTIGCLGSLSAQVPFGWAQLRTAQEAVPDVGVRLISVAGGWQLYFKNFGSKSVHFDFILKGLQTTDSIPDNGRVHLKPGNPVGPIQISAASGGADAINVEALNVLVGNGD